MTPPRISAEKTILVADDEELIRLGREAVLKRNGYTVLLAVDGKEALDIFRAVNIERGQGETRQQINLVVTDYRMPNMNGLTLAKNVWDLDPNMPIILATGEELQVLSMSALQKKMRLPAIIKKPIREEHLLDLVHVACQNDGE